MGGKLFNVLSVSRDFVRQRKKVVTDLQRIPERISKIGSDPSVDSRHPRHPSTQCFCSRVRRKKFTPVMRSPPEVSRTSEEPIRQILITDRPHPI